VQQPASGKAAAEHYQKTVVNPVPLARIAPHVTRSVMDELESIYPDGNAWIWGATSGREGEWVRIEPGDLVLFYRDKRFFSSAHVTFKLKNGELAQELWSLDDAGRPWSFVYFLDTPADIDIPVATFNQALGYRPANIVQGMHVLSQSQSDTLRAELFREDASKQYRDILKSLPRYSDPNRPVQAMARREQAALRDALLEGRPSAQCGVCGKEFPANLLVAAHIKPRSKCSVAEMNDPFIATLMCALGCDALYERGFIAVRRGMILVRKNDTDTLDIKARLELLAGRQCLAWSIENAKYFKWHLQYIKRAS